MSTFPLVANRMNNIGKTLSMSRRGQIIDAILAIPSTVTYARCVEGHDPVECEARRRRIDDEVYASNLRMKTDLELADYAAGMVARGVIVLGFDLPS